MSSTPLHRLADPRPIVTALTDVAETSLYAYVDVLEPTEFVAAAGGAATWLRARLRFSGPASGTFTMHLPAALASTLAAAFAGESLASAGDPDRLVVDFTGEVANMVCGAWLTRACREVAFDLSAPQVEAGAPPPDLAGVCVFAAVCDAPVSLHIALEGSQAAPGAAGARDGVAR